MPFATINHKPLFYTDTHPSSSPHPKPKLTTIFIHGLGSSSCYYAPVIPSLSHLTRCIALDTPGSGLSPLADDGEASIKSIAEDVIALLNVTEVIGGVVVVGHSMGGIVANYLASYYASRVKAVVLLGPVNASPALTEVFEKRIEVVKKDGLEVLANTLPQAATSPTATALTHAFIRTLILSITKDGYLALCRAIINAPAFPSSVKELSLSNITIPLLILCGKDDKTAPLSMSESILGAYGTEEGEGTGKRIKELEGVGHWYCIEKPGVIGRELVAFLEGLA